MSGGEGLDEAVVDFCRFARVNGLAAGVKESLTALEAVRAVGVMDRQTLKAALRAVLCSSKAGWELFEEVFAGFWGFNEGSLRRPEQHQKSGTTARELPPQQEQAGLMLSAAGKAKVVEKESGKALVGATAYERLKRVDFSEIAPADLADLEQVALRLLRQMSLRLSRRLKAASRSGPVDLRRTIRLSISQGGDLIYLSFRGRKREPLRLVVLLDVSGSMNPYSFFLLCFAYALQRYFRRVDTFLFSTRLSDITGALRTRHLRDALQALSQETAGWSGGTKIGESLREFRTGYGNRLSRNTLLMVLSDG